MTLTTPASSHFSVFVIVSSEEVNTNCSPTSNPAYLPPPRLRFLRIGILPGPRSFYPTDYSNLLSFGPCIPQTPPICYLLQPLSLQAKPLALIYESTVTVDGVAIGQKNVLHYPQLASFQLQVEPQPRSIPGPGISPHPGPTAINCLRGSIVNRTGSLTRAAPVYPEALTSTTSRDFFSHVDGAVAKFFCPCRVGW